MNPAPIALLLLVSLISPLSAEETAKPAKAKLSEIVTGSLPIDGNARVENTPGYVPGALSETNTRVPARVYRDDEDLFIRFETKSGRQIRGYHLIISDKDTLKKETTVAVSFQVRVGEITLDKPNLPGSVWISPDNLPKAVRNQDINLMSEGSPKNSAQSIPKDKWVTVEGRWTYLPPPTGEHTLRSIGVHVVLNNCRGRVDIRRIKMDVVPTDGTPNGVRIVN